MRLALAAGAIVLSPSLLLADGTCVLQRVTAVRRGPSSTAPALANAPAGMSLQVLRPVAGWVEVTTPGITKGAFVAEPSCTLTYPPDPAPAASPQASSAVVPSLAASAPTRAAASPTTAEARPEKRKGSFWKKVGVAALIGLAAYAEAQSGGQSYAPAPAAYSPPPPASARPAPPASFVTGTATTTGPTTFYNFSNGVSGSSQTYGNQTFTWATNGQTSTTNRVGRQAFTTFSNGTSSTSTRVGNQTFTNFSTGVTSTTNRIGNQTFTAYSNGRMCTSNRIGTQVFTTCN